MITAIHNLVYADDPEAGRVFFRDGLKWPYADAHGGWLTFGTGPSELGVRPTSRGGPQDGGRTPQRHETTLMCDDIAAAVAERTARGAQFTGAVRDDGFGLTTALQVPGAGELMLDRAKHSTAFDR